LHKKIFVGNLPYDAEEIQIKDWFVKNGFPAEGVAIVTDRFSGQPRGFGFVEMREESATRCVLACNGRNFLGRTLIVNDATPLL
jgi:RNA recognition motif-containing protein